MKKTYLKPEVEIISLITEEKITTDSFDGVTGVESDNYGL